MGWPIMALFFHWWHLMMLQSNHSQQASYPPHPTRSPGTFKGGHRLKNVRRVFPHHLFVLYPCLTGSPRTWEELLKEPWPKDSWKWLSKRSKSDAKWKGVFTLSWLLPVSIPSTLYSIDNYPLVKLGHLTFYLSYHIRRNVPLKMMPILIHALCFLLQTYWKILTVCCVFPDLLPEAEGNSRPTYLKITKLSKSG